MEAPEVPSKHRISFILNKPLSKARPQILVDARLRIEMPFNALGGIVLQVGYYCKGRSTNVECRFAQSIRGGPVWWCVKKATSFPDVCRGGCGCQENDYSSEYSLQ